MRAGVEKADILPDGEFERRHVLVVDLVDLCPPLQQDPHHLLPPAAHGVVQRRRVPEVVMLNTKNIPVLALHCTVGDDVQPGQMVISGQKPS